MMPLRRRDRLQIVASGSAVKNLVLHYRRLYGGDLFAVLVGSPKSPEPIYDLAIASHHAVLPGQIRSDTFYGGAKTTLWIPGVLTRSMKIEGRKQENMAVAMIGGINKAFRIDPHRIAEQLRPVLSRNKLAVVFSRRTECAVEQYLRTTLSSPNTIFIGRSDRNGFRDAFAGACEYYVTPDSITMICEACSSQRPVTVLHLECFNSDTSTARFVREFIDAGYVRSAEDQGSRSMTPLPSVETIKRAAISLHSQWATS